MVTVVVAAALGLRVVKNTTRPTMMASTITTMPMIRPLLGPLCGFSGSAPGVPPLGLAGFVGLLMAHHPCCGLVVGCAVLGRAVVARRWPPTRRRGHMGTSDFEGSALSRTRVLWREGLSRMDAVARGRVEQVCSAGAEHSPTTQHGHHHEGARHELVRRQGGTASGGGRVDSHHHPHGSGAGAPIAHKSRRDPRALSTTSALRATSPPRAAGAPAARPQATHPGISAHSERTGFLQ